MDSTFTSLETLLMDVRVLELISILMERPTGVLGMKNDMPEIWEMSLLDKMERLPST
jgi:hypothetical protein